VYVALTAAPTECSFCSAHSSSNSASLHGAAAAAAAGKCVLSFNDQLNAEQHVAEALKALKA
jgi:hypothetical protein